MERAKIDRLSEELAYDGVTIPWNEPDARLIEDVGLDSFEHVLLFIAAESTLGVILDDSKLTHVRTVGEFLRLLDSIPGARPDRRL
jgi:acyl carrier protein